MAHNSDAELIAKVRQATAKYLDVKKSKADGYQMVNTMEANMGYHFLNKNIPGFALDKPNLLLSVKHDDSSFQLAGIEWGWPKGKQPKNLPFKNAQWAIHENACHYQDGSKAHKASPKEKPQVLHRFRVLASALIDCSRLGLVSESRGGVQGSQHDSIAVQQELGLSF